MARGAQGRPTCVLDGVVHAQCLGCAQWKPRDTAYHRRTRPGQQHRSRCKECLRAQRSVMDDERECQREALQRAARSPLVTQVLNGKRLTEGAPPLCLLPLTHSDTSDQPYPTAIDRAPPLAHLLTQFDEGRVR